MAAEGSPAGTLPARNPFHLQALYPEVRVTGVFTISLQPVSLSSRMARRIDPGLSSPLGPQELSLYA